MPFRTFQNYMYLRNETLCIFLESPRTGYLRMRVRASTASCYGLGHGAAPELPAACWGPSAGEEAACLATETHAHLGKLGPTKLRIQV